MEIPGMFFDPEGELPGEVMPEFTRPPIFRSIDDALGERFEHKTLAISISHSLSGVYWSVLSFELVLGLVPHSLLP
jgi:hypothetical protein